MARSDELKAALKDFTADDVREWLDTSGLDPVAIKDSSLCLQCGLEYRFNVIPIPVLAAASDDGANSGWGVGDAPTNLMYCIQCKARTLWGSRPAGNQPLPGEAPNPDLQDGCTHRNGNGDLALRYSPTQVRQTEYVTGLHGVEQERFRDVPGKPQYQCHICGKLYHGKRNTLTRLGWIADLDNPVGMTPIPRNNPPEPDTPDPDLELEREEANTIARLRETYEIPMEAYNLREIHNTESNESQCLYDVMTTNYELLENLEAPHVPHGTPKMTRKEVIEMAKAHGLVVHD